MGITASEIANGSESFEMLKQAAKDAGATTQFSASQAGEALNYLALCGYDAEKAVAAFIESVTEALVSGDKVQLVGFGSFEVRRREERAGRDPRTGNAITIPASNSPAFKAGKAHKDAVNK